MADEPENPSPKPKKPRKPYQRVTREIYERMADVYLAGSRTTTEVARLTGVARSTADAAIREGWPSRGWAPLRERAKLYDKNRERAQEEKVANPPDPERADLAASFIDLRLRNLEMANVVRGVLAHALLRIGSAMPGADVVEMRPVRRVVHEEIYDKDGKVSRRVPRVVTVDEPHAPTTQNLVHALREVSQIMEVVGEYTLHWGGAKAPAGMEGRDGYERLSDEEVEYMAKNGGKLPPGVPLEKFLRSVGLPR